MQLQDIGSLAGVAAIIGAALGKGWRVLTVDRLERACKERRAAESVADELYALGAPDHAELRRREGAITFERAMATVDVHRRSMATYWSWCVWITCYVIGGSAACVVRWMPALKWPGIAGISAFLVLTFPALTLSAREKRQIKKRTAERVRRRDQLIGMDIGPLMGVTVSDLGVPSREEWLAGLDHGRVGHEQMAAWRRRVRR